MTDRQSSAIPNARANLRRQDQTDHSGLLVRLAPKMPTRLDRAGVSCLNRLTRDRRDQKVAKGNDHKKLRHRRFKAALPPARVVWNPCWQMR